MRGLIKILIVLFISLGYLFFPQPSEAGSLCTGERADAVVITISNWVSAFDNFVSIRNSQGIITRVFSVEDIIVNYTGSDTQDKMRNFIKDAYATWDISYVILGGDVAQVPTRMIENPYYYAGDHSSGLMGCDFYYACLDGTWNNDGDLIYGETVEDGVDWYPEVFLGRLSSDTFEEMQRIANNCANYNTTGWGKSQLLCGADTVIQGDGAAFKENDIRRRYFNYTNWGITKLYQHPLNDPGSDNLTTANVNSAINNGVGLVNFSGHGSVYSIAKSQGTETYWHSSDALNITNGLRLPFIFAYACLTGTFEYADNCLGENFLKAVNGGIIGYVGATGVAFTNTASQLDKLLFAKVSEQWRQMGKLRPGVCFYTARTEFINYYFGSYPSATKTAFQFQLLGDPTALMNLLPATPDTYAPHISIAFVTPNAQEKNLPVTIEAMVSDNDDVSSVWANILKPDGLEVDLPLELYSFESYRATFSDTSLAGDYQITVYAKDISANISSLTAGTLHIYLNTNPPQITNAHLLPSTAYVGQIIEVYADVTDDTNVRSVWMTVSKTDNSENYNLWMYHTGLGNTYKGTVSTLSPPLLGDYQVVVYAQDPSGNQAQADAGTFVVLVDTIPPTITNASLSATTVQIGGSLDIFADITDNGRLSDPILAIITRPDGSVFTNVMSNFPFGTDHYKAMIFFPSGSQLGTYTAEVLARDFSFNETRVLVGSFTVTEEVNNPPVLNPIGNKTVNEGSLLQFTVSATDPDGDPLTYSASGLPSGATFVGQTFSWTPNYNQAGNYNVTFTVSDGELTDSETITITVNNVDQPNAPSNLTASAFSRTQINLVWQDNSNNETGFKIERGRKVQGNINFSQIAIVGANVTTYSNTGLSPNTLYYYRVRAYNGTGNSGYSNTASAKTLR